MTEHCEPSAIGAGGRDICRETTAVFDDCTNIDSKTWCHAWRVGRHLRWIARP